MKIEKDFTEFINLKNRINNSAGSLKIKRNTSLNRNRADSALQNSISLRMNREKALSDALAIAQTSQAVLQKAMTVFMKLRNIAAKAISSGNINPDEINRAVVEIDSAIKEYGENIVIPQQSWQSNNPDHINSGGLNSVRKLAEDMANNKDITGERISSTGQSIAINLESNRKSVEDIKASIKKIVKEYPQQEYKVIESQKKSLIENINRFPGLLLSIQGNVNPEKVSRFL